MEFIDLDAPPTEVLRSLGKDTRLIPYGGGNYGMPLGLIEPAHGRAVPNDRFYMRCNGPIPLLDAETWRLDVSGAVDRPLSLSLADLQRLPQRRLEAFLECAGNGRTRFDPTPPGTPWRNDAVGNAIWEGVALADVLALAGVRPETVDIVTQGADFSEMRRGLPLAVARDRDVMLVWSMNDEPLPVAHGGPVRLFVPGWAGIASTKWLVGLEAIDRAFSGIWNVDNYVFWNERGDPLRPVTELPPKSVIVTPVDGETRSPGPIAVAGWAWSGYGGIERVDVSTDGGATWQAARVHPGVRRSWRRWEIDWVAPAGYYRIQARATDERRLSQPDVAPWNAKGYLMNAIHEIALHVES